MKNALLAVTPSSLIDDTAAHVGSGLAVQALTGEVLSIGTHSKGPVYGHTLIGTSGADEFVVGPDGAGTEIRNAAAGDSILVLLPETSTVDLLDWFSYGRAANGVDFVVQLGGITIAVATGAAGVPLSVDAVESSMQSNSLGGDGNDLLTGNKYSDLMFGSNGDDTINGLSGSDFVNDGYGNDRVFLGGGNDTFIGGHSAFAGDNDDIRGAGGNDFIQSYVGADSVRGDSGNDWIDADDIDVQSAPSADIVSGGKGDDTIFADAGDTVAGDAGADDFYFSGTGSMTVKDFAVGVDSLHVDTFGKTVTLTTTDGSDTLVNLDGVLVAALNGVAFGSATFADLI